MQRIAGLTIVALVVTMALASTAIGQTYQKGDLVQVEWKGAVYGARIIGVDGASKEPAKMKYHITYVGYDSSWDEWIGVGRIKGKTKGAGGASLKQYKPGILVEIKWKSAWFLGRILEKRDGKAKVHYVGWGDNWDEWVGPDRLRKAGDYKVGDVLECEWKGAYYKAKIIEFKGDPGKPETNQYKITYPGWDKKWDEWVAVKRLRRK